MLLSVCFRMLIVVIILDIGYLSHEESALIIPVLECARSYRLSMVTACRNLVAMEKLTSALLRRLHRPERLRVRDAHVVEQHQFVAVAGFAGDAERGCQGSHHNPFGAGNVVAVSAGHEDAERMERVPADELAEIFG
jgi:hypothetical protein